MSGYLTQRRRAAEVAKVRLGEVCEVISGSTPRTTVTEYWGGDLPWITPAELKGDVWVYDTVKHLTQAGVESASLKIIPEGSVLLTSRAPIGKVALAGRSMYCNQGFKNLICCDRVFNKYLYYWLKSHSELLNSLGRGATFKEISKSIVERVEIPLPPLADQKQIAAKLDAICEIVSKREEQLKKLDQLVKSRFVEMFGDLNVNPKKWPTDRLGGVCDVRDGTHASPTYHDVGYPLMTSKNFANGYEDFSDVKLISEEDFLEINRRSKVDAGDIVMPMIGTIGHPVIASAECPYAIKNVALIKFLEASPCNVYVKTVLESSYFERAVAGTSRGNTQKFIALGDIRSFVLPLPPLALQREFAAFVAEVDKSKFAVRKSLESYQKLYRQQLQEAFG